MIAVTAAADAWAKFWAVLPAELSTPRGLAAKCYTRHDRLIRVLGGREPGDLIWRKLTRVLLPTMAAFEAMQSLPAWQAYAERRPLWVRGMVLTEQRLEIASLRREVGAEKFAPSTVTFSCRAGVGAKGVR